MNTSLVTSWEQTKAAIENQKAQWKTFGSPQNMTEKGRKLGVTAIKNKATQNTQCQKTVRLIVRCKKAWMGFTRIAKMLNKNGFLTVRGKQFRKETVRRLYKSHSNSCQKWKINWV